ncbi:MFS transporter [Eremomyces bilateralis CBS 781.70]|uniref:MFS transporter n=1 Tax=Eremomyces bilateralis CBS 781.70 TaxID=1392243 RepID=A0A6G1GIF0_9PEZI|nr:MFS transporter [Eremomyces bilateralis CBS 781.70]KAF1817640.1 MFS transporter [Eremomyces bilateralis CBS 781.70]
MSAERQPAWLGADEVVGASNTRSGSTGDITLQEEDIVPAAEGGVMGSKQVQDTDEETPLIRKTTSTTLLGEESEERGDFDGLPWYKKPSIFWMLPPYLLSTMAFGGVMVPKLNLILTLICREYFADQALADPTFTYLPVVFGEENEQCRDAGVQSRVAQFNLAGTVISGLLAALVSPKLGALSDRYGRKLIIVLTNFGMFSGEIITIFAAKYPDIISVYWILVGFVFDGMCGSFITSMALAHSYATDCTPPSKRNVAFGYFHGCLFTGIAIGPIVAGYIVKKTGTVLPVFYYGIAAHILFIALLAFVIPESLSKSRQLLAREKYRVKHLASGPPSFLSSLRPANFFEPLRILYPTGPGSSSALRSNLLVLAAVDTLGFGVAMGAFQIIVIYSNFMFGWDTYTQSLFISIVNTCRVFGLLVILPLLNGYGRRWLTGTTHVSRSGSDTFELNIIRVAVMIDTLGFLGYSFARDGKLFTLSGIVASFGGMGAPTLQSVLTKHVPPDKTGQLLGALGLLHALARVISPTIFNGIYSATVGKYSPTVFICLTATFFLAFACALFIRPNVYLPEQEEYHDDDYRENDELLANS